jgi:DNA adenine methylase
MPFYTPLRYPGGKRRLAPTVMSLLESNGLRDVEYVEPYAGGASLALALLLEEYASTIHINDLSRPIYAFWHSVLNDTANLCRRIESVEITMAEWHRQRAVYDQRDTAALDDLAFATLFLNRTNRSGIIAGGVIGGKNQAGEWKLNARFKKSELIRRIKQIGRYKSRIKLHQLDALELTNRLLPQIGTKNTFVFYDPPYIEKGKDLYLNNYKLEDHQRLAKRIIQLGHPWVVTYDYDAAIRHRLYGSHRRLVYELPYSAQARYAGKEVMFLSERLKLPDNWSPSVPISMTAPHSENPLYGKLESMNPKPRLTPKWKKTWKPLTGSSVH